MGNLDDRSSSTDRPGPLAGVRVLEIATVLAGPFAGHLLHLLGAEVIKVEGPGGDPFRTWGAAPGETGEMFSWANAGKRSLVVDFAEDPEAATAVLQQVQSADVLLVSGRPGALDRRGLSHEACLAANPDLVVASLSGFGVEGPLRDRPAYDSVIQAVSGLLWSYGVRSDVVSTSLPSLADMVGGLVLAQGALAGLVSVGRGGGGRVIETSLYEALGTVMAPTYLRASGEGDRLQQSLIFQLPCSDGEELVVHLSTSDSFWRKLAGALDPALLDDERFSTYAGRTRHYDQLRARLAAAVVGDSAHAWASVLTDADVPASPVLTPGQARDHEQARATGLVVRAVDGRVSVGAPWRIDGARPGPRGDAPGLGLC